MKKEIIFTILIASILILGLGCSGKKAQVVQPETGYSVKMSSNKIIAPGSIVVNFAIKNIFLKEMRNTEISILGVPSSYSVSGTNSLGTIMNGQEIPVIFNIGTEKDVNVKEEINPKIKVCFDYQSDFYFDIAFKKVDMYSQEIATPQSCVKGPVNITREGLDTIFEKQTNPVLNLNIQNSWIGTIQKFNKISLDIPSSDYIEGGALSYSLCKNETNTKGVSISIPDQSDNCGILNNAAAIANGIITSVTLSVPKELGISSPVTERFTGFADYRYCYEVPLEKITVCPAGSPC